MQLSSNDSRCRAPELVAHQMQVFVELRFVVKECVFVICVLGALAWYSTYAEELSRLAYRDDMYSAENPQSRKLKSALLVL